MNIDSDTLKKIENALEAVAASSEYEKFVVTTVSLRQRYEEGNFTKSDESNFQEVYNLARDKIANVLASIFSEVILRQLRVEIEKKISETLPFYWHIHSELKKMEKEETRKYYKMIKKLRPRSYLEMKLHEHQAMFGGTPPPEMAQNPDKTRADLMTDEELLVFLRDAKREIEKWLKEDKRKHRPSVRESVIRGLKSCLRHDIDYLEEIGRLPKEFEDFDVSSLK